MPSEQNLPKPLFIYDGDCSFCKFWIEYWKQLTGPAVSYAPYQEVASQFPQIPLESFRVAAQFVEPGGRVSSAAEAVFRTLAYAPGKNWLWWLYAHVGVFAALSEATYRWVARHRSFLYGLTRLLWGKRGSDGSGNG